MWVSRNRNGNLMLHPFSKPTYNENTGKWSQGRGWHSCVIPNIYPDLKCEDGPIEVKFTKVDRHYIQCNNCSRAFSYLPSDIETTFICTQPSSEYGDEFEFITCPHCGVRIYL